jgi:hypothetical protein
MGHVRVALGLEEAAHPHRARAAYARKVVAAQIDEHHVLGTILFRSEQVLGIAGAGLRRSRDRVHAGSRPFQLHESLRGRADERDLAELKEEVVRGRIDPPQRPVQGERRDVRLPLGPL